MKNTVFGIALICCMHLLLSCVSADDSAFGSYLTGDVANAVDLTYNMEFEKALKAFDSCRDQMPDYTLAFLKSCVYYWKYQTRMEGKEREAVEKKYLRLLEQTIAACRKDDQEPNARRLFFLGAAYGNRGRYLGMEGKWMKAYFDGRKGKKYLQRVLKKDSSVVDAKLGLGMFKYYAAKLPGIIKPLTFIIGVSGSSKKGLKYITQAAQNGIYSRIEATFFLGHIYGYYEFEYEKALEIFTGLCKRYPGNSVFAHNRNHCLYYLGLESTRRLNYTKAQEYFRRIREAYTGKSRIKFDILDKEVDVEPDFLFKFTAPSDTALAILCSVHLWKIQIACRTFDRARKTAEYLAKGKSFPENCRALGCFLTARTVELEKGFEQAKKYYINCLSFKTDIPFSQAVKRAATRGLESPLTELYRIRSLVVRKKYKSALECCKQMMNSFERANCPLAFYKDFLLLNMAAELGLKEEEGMLPKKSECRIPRRLTR